MKKILGFAIVAITIVSCSNGQSTTTGDTANTTNPSIIKDSGTQHPNGVTSDGVISTDTAAFGVKATKGDSTQKK